ncbi:MAG: hypothetical protein ACLQKA_05370 [Bryobacteraceae bacterium]
MKNAYELKEHFSKDGKCLSRERTIGPIVVWAIVAIIALVAGKALSLPTVFWHGFR